MSLSAIVRALAAAGASVDMIVAAVEAHEGVTGAAIDRRRATDAERQKRARERKVNNVTSRESRDSNVTKRDKEVSPTPPSRNIPPSTPKGVSGSTDQATADFAEFWENYPNKTGKPKAQQAYRRAISRADPIAILSGLNRVRRGWDDPRYVPHPTTWLNRDGWNDQASTGEPTPATPGQPAPAWDDDRWRTSIDLGLQHGRWDQRWGPPPDDPATRCPEHLRHLWTRKAA